MKRIRVSLVVILGAWLLQPQLQLEVTTMPPPHPSPDHPPHAPNDEPHPSQPSPPPEPPHTMR